MAADQASAGADDDRTVTVGAVGARDGGVLRRLGWLGTRLVNLVVPPVCLACQTPLAMGDALCAGCWREVHFIRAPLCDRLGIPLPFDSGGPTVSARALAHPPVFDRARAVARHTGVMRRMIHDFKYNDRHDARRLFGRWLAEAGRELLAEADLLVPVPLHRLRLFSRRFNQSALLAAEVARRCAGRHAPLVIERRRATRSQVGLSEAQRRDNMAGAFRVVDRARRQIEGARIVLVDDVMTTGATVSACAGVLKRAGAAQVDVLTLAMVTDDDRIGL